MAKRLKSYRHGDRAEALGIVMLQSICAVAAVPRQEDWGVFDATATLLRREGKFLHAEDTFLVQFKSAGVRKISLDESAFQNLLAQELDYYIASVDLKCAKLQLFAVGPAIGDAFRRDAKTVTFCLGEQGSRKSAMFHLGSPILEWTVADLEDSGFQERAFFILQRWLQHNRTNRRNRALGLVNGARWKTNEAPLQGGQTWTGSQSIDLSKIDQVRPSLDYLAIHAYEDPILAEPLLKVFQRLRELGAEESFAATMLATRRAMQEAEDLKKAMLADHKDADAVHVIVASSRIAPETLSLTVSLSNAMRTYRSTLAELKEIGIRIDLAEDGQSYAVTDITAPFIDPSKARFLRMEGNALLYKRIDKTPQPYLHLEGPASEQ